MDNEKQLRRSELTRNPYQIQKREKNDNKFEEVELKVEEIEQDKLCISFSNFQDVSDNKNNIKLLIGEWDESEEDTSDVNVFPGVSSIKTESDLKVEVSDESSDQPVFESNIDSKNFISDLVPEQLDLKCDQLSPLDTGNFSGNKAERVEMDKTCIVKQMLNISAIKGTTAHALRNNVEEVQTDPRQDVPRLHIDSTHRNRKKFECHLCLFHSSLKSHLSAHIAKVHFNVKKFECDQCGFGCLTKAKLTLHFERVHPNARKINCHLCEYFCSQKSNLYFHINRDHFKTKIFKCELCTLHFTNQNELSAHIRRAHRKVKKFKCHLCLHYFERKSYLSSHIERVHNIRRFKCNDCDLVCSTKSYGDRICEYYCSQKSDLNFDINRTHFKTKIFKCEQCTLHFTNQSDLSAHIHRAHRKVNKFKCHLCLHYFVRKSYLSSHIERTHNIRRFN